MKLLTIFLSVLFTMITIKADSCVEEKLFTSLYAQQYLAAQKNDENTFKALHTEQSINDIEMQLTYFKKQNKKMDFMTLVHTSVDTDPKPETLVVYDCKIKEKKARILYTVSGDSSDVTILILMFEKVNGKWKIGEYGESALKRASIKTFTETLDTSPYFKSFHL